MVGRELVISRIRSPYVWSCAEQQTAKGEVHEALPDDERWILKEQVLIV